MRTNPQWLQMGFDSPSWNEKLINIINLILKTMTKDELKDYLVEEVGYTRAEVDKFDSYILLNEYLEWNGICGWTDDIISVVKASGITRTNFYREM